MFDEGKPVESELWPYRKTSWQPLNGGEHPSQPSVQPVTADPPRSPLLHTVRGIVGKNETIVLIAVLLLMLCDCEDDTELLIAIALLLGPMLLGRR